MEYEKDNQYREGTAMPYDTRPMRKCFSRIGLAYVVYVVVSSASQILVMWLLKEPESIREWNIWMMLVMLSMYPVAMLLFYLMLRKLPKARQTWREPMTVGRYLCLFVICMGITYLGNLIGQILTALIGLLTGESVWNDMEELLSSMEPWLILFEVVLVAPVMEELIFRKMLLDRIAGYGQITSMVVSGLIFGLAHGNLNQFFYAFALGMIFAHVYLRTGNVIYTIGLHMLINFCGSFLTMYLADIIMNYDVAGVLIAVTQLMVMFAFMAIAVFLLVYYRKEILLSGGPSKTSKGKWFLAVFGNVGMVLFLMVGAGLFFL